MKADGRWLIAKSSFVKVVHRTIIVAVFNLERVMLSLGPNAILWLARVILRGPIGLPPAKCAGPLTLGAIPVRQNLPITL
jgi:hypothetical protein